MNNNSNTTMVKQRSPGLRRLGKRHRGATKVIAVSLAFIMAFSLLSANISSIVNLLEAYADTELDKYYNAKVTLYDYYTDNEIKGGGDNNLNNGKNRNQVFNTALYESSYVQNAGTWGSLNYFPLYLGLQFPGQKTERNTYNQMITDTSNAYKYSIIANSQAGTGGTSYAAQGLVDSTLADGNITQGGSPLPYFDKDFLETPISSLLTSSSISSLGVSGHASHTLGEKTGTYNFKFKKVGDYYVYDAGGDSLGSNSGKSCGLTYSGGTFTVTDSAGDKYSTLTSGTGSGYGFLPYSVMRNSHSYNNYGFGAVFEIPFTMSTNGYMTSTDSNGYVTEDTSKPIKFNFSGDDDVWVFIDDQLILDIGGAHGRVAGEINFQNDGSSTPYASVTNIKNPGSFYQQTGNATSLTNGTVTDNSVASTLMNLGLYDDPGKTHTLKMFYIERGSLESNCYISFNFTIADMISVTNKIDTSPVTDRDLLAATNTAVSKEAVEYAIGSNSGTCSMESPDVEKQYEEVKPASYYTLSFNLGKAGYGSIASKQVAEGKRVALPTSGPNVKRSGYNIVGWSTSPPPSLNSSEGATLVSSPYAVNGSQTLYAVWEEADYAPLELPPSPTIFYIYTKPASWTNNGRTEYRNITGHSGPVNNVARNACIGNFTGKNLARETYSFWVQTQDQYIQDGNYQTINGSQVQHPNNQNNYSLTDNAGSNSGISRNGDRIKLSGINGGLYYWKITGQLSSEISKTDNISGVNTGNTQADNWVKAYEQLYENLKNWAENANNDKDTLKSSEKRAIYEEAVNKYKDLQPPVTNYSIDTGDGNYPTNVWNKFQDDIGNVVTPDNTPYNYTYTTDNTVTFYFYADSTVPAENISVAAANSYDDDTNVNPDYTDTKPYTFSAYTVPGNVTPADDGTGNYYVVTVDRNVKKAKEADPSDYTLLDNNIAITVNGVTKTVTAAEMEAMNVTYPCFYFSLDKSKNIPDEFPSVQYGFADYATIWFYSTSNIAGQTVTCVNDYDTSGDTVYSANLAADGGVADYYYAVLPKTAVRKEETRETQLVTMKLNDTNVNFTSTASGYANPCYYSTSNGASGTGWANLVTAVMEVPNWNNNGTPNTWWTDAYLYVAQGSSSYIASSGGWNSNPCTNQHMTSIASPTIYYNNSTTEHPRYYYIYVPSESGMDHVFMSKNTGSLGNNDSARSEVISSITSDTLFAFNRQNNETIYYNQSAIGSSSDYYAYTATAKSADRLGAATNKPTLNVLNPQATVPDDPDAAGEGDNTDPTEPTEPNNTDGASGYTPKTGQFQNTKGNWNYAGNTNFKLYDERFYNLTGEEKEYVVRQTTTNGTFNLLKDQTAKFTYQFNRGEEVKIAQDGDSYSFGETDINRATTVKPPESQYTLGAGNEEHIVTSEGKDYDEFESTGSKVFNYDEDNVPLYHRYSTAWTISDENEDPSFTQSQRYNIAKDDTTGTDYTISGGTNSLTIKNLNGSAYQNDGIHLLVEYTNTVRVGSLTVRKQLTDDAIQAVLDYRKNYVSTYDPTFYFKVTFQHVFGDQSGEEVEYKGDWKLGTVSGGNLVYTDKTVSDYSNVTIGDTTIQYCIPFKYSDLYDTTKTELDDVKASYKLNVFRIENIPVYTEFSVLEYVKKDNSSEPDLTFNTATLESGVLTGSGVVTPLNDTILDEAGVTGNTLQETLKTKVVGESLDPAVNVASGSLGQYFETDNAGNSDLNYQNYVLTAYNGLPGNCYLIITKTIDNFYYFTQQGDTSTDNPAGLAATGGTVGGGASTTDDYNGYQDATKAEQSFLFRIDIVDHETQGSFMFESGYETYFPNYNIGSFYEYISFGPEDFAANPRYLTKSVVLKVNPEYSYVVHELDDWSWKYELTNVTVNPQGSETGLDQNNEEIGHNLVKNNYYAQVETFTESFTNIRKQDRTILAKVENAAQVTFTNHKDPDKKDVEGDTTVADNSCSVPEHTVGYYNDEDELIEQ